MIPQSSTSETDEAHRILLDGEALWHVYEKAPIGMAVLTPEAMLLRVNPALCNLVGYDADELLGRSIMEITHPDKVALKQELDQKMPRGNLPQFQLEKRYIHKSGQIINILLSAE